MDPEYKVLIAIRMSPSHAGHCNRRTTVVPKPRTVNLNSHKPK